MFHTADIFDHRGGEVDGRTFRDWWIDEYMITNETLYHKDPVTGEPQVGHAPRRARSWACFQRQPLCLHLYSHSNACAMTSHISG